MTTEIDEKALAAAVEEHFAAGFKSTPTEAMRTAITAYLAATRTSEAAEPVTVPERQQAWAALRMIADAVGELFGPAASIESEDASLLRGPEYHHFAEGIVEALQRAAPHP